MKCAGFLALSLFVFSCTTENLPDILPAKAFANVHTVPHGIVTNLTTTDSVIALTFDACETITPSYFDTSIMFYLLRNKIPFTLFMGGKFAVRNRAILRDLAFLKWVEIENHSFDHDQHMERMADSAAIMDVKNNRDSLWHITSRLTKFFRFPGGNYDDQKLRLIESLGYRVVHWSFESGDPDKRITPARLSDWVISKSKPGTILIFHINGRGYSTGKALPTIIESLKKRGYRFVTLGQRL